MVDNDLIGEAQLRHIVESAMDAIITVDAEQRIVLINPAAQRMFRCSAKDALGSPVDRFIPERFRRAHQGHVETFGRTRVTNRRMGMLGSVIGQRADGDEFPAEASISQFDTPTGKFYTVILRDISERRRIEEQLRQTERLAELGTLASGMAHEVGTPMNVILGRAEYLMRRTQEEQTRKGLETIVAQVERITKIMNQLLTFARRRPSERRAMDLRRIIEDCLEVLSERLARDHVQADIAIPSDLPPVHADPDLMSQVFLNLFINALHAMPNGGTLRVEGQRSNDQITLNVVDTGEGIPREHLLKIFDPFFTTKEVGKGTGLGLTVVHGIVQEHGGTIAVSSQPGHGTVFTLTLPLSPPQ